MGRRSMVLATGVWLAVVVVVSVATWTVIDAAGRDVTVRPASDPAAAGGAARTLTPGSPTSQATTRTRPHRRPSRTPSPRRTASTRPLPTAQPTGVPESTSPVPTPQRTTPAPPPAPEPQERTWTGSAGSVSARCTGTRIGLVTATPANGWRMAVDERGPSRVRVEFHTTARSEGESGSDDGSGGGDSVEVRAECVGGAPRFRVDA